MYQGIPFQVRPVQDLLQDIDRARDFYGAEVKTVFLGDSDPLIQPAEDLLQILGHICKIFPYLERITSYARMQTIKRRSLSQLISFRQAGLTRLHVGLESGSPRLLKCIKKGATPQEMIEGTQKGREAGLEISLYVLLGIGGVEFSSHQAQKTSEVINRGHPDMVRLRTLSPLPGTPLAQAVEGGFFQPLSPLQRLEETRSLVAGIAVGTLLYSDHVTNFLQTKRGPIYKGVFGRLPEERGRILQELDAAVTLLQDNREIQKEILPPGFL